MAVVSSCRETFGWVRRRAQPMSLVASSSAVHSSETARVEREEGVDDVKSVWPLCPGLRTCYSGRSGGRRCCEAERVLGVGPSSDWSLRLDSMKSESLVKACRR